MAKTKTSPRYIDLHTHTLYSDGLGMPEASVRLARMNGIDILAITDHDKIEGYEEARIAGEKWQVQIIPGVEISTNKYHILGLGVDLANSEFLNLLNLSIAEQKRICIKRIEALQQRGVPITLEKILKLSPNSRLGKMNILYTMMQDKECQDYFMKKEGAKLDKELYDVYLRNKDGKYIDDKATAVTPQLAIKTIHNAGGIAIIAHPFIDIENMTEMDILKEQGIDGVEVQPRGGKNNSRFANFATENNLLITHGSDYHGGVFGRLMLSAKRENILSERLAEALGIN